MPAILFVEDDTTIAMGVEYSLKQDGFRVSLACRLDEARDQLKRQPFHLARLDLGLPDGSGYELCREIRASGDTPIIIFSSRDEEASIVLGLDLGADEHEKNTDALGSEGYVVIITAGPLDRVRPSVPNRRRDKEMALALRASGIRSEGSAPQGSFGILGCYNGFPSASCRSRIC